MHSEKSNSIKDGVKKTKEKSELNLGFLTNSEICLLCDTDVDTANEEVNRIVKRVLQNNMDYYEYIKDQY